MKYIKYFYQIMQKYEVYLTLRLLFCQKSCTFEIFVVPLQAILKYVDCFSVYIRPVFGLL